MIAGSTFRKPQLVRGKQLQFRDATVADAEFILGLRTDEKKGRYLSATTADVDTQRGWLTSYASDDSQVYFIICALDGTPVGTVRLYDQQDDSFCWGSWIKSDTAPRGFGVESTLMIYDFALQLGFRRSHFDVRQQNVSVIQFHERMGATRTGETELDYLFEMSNDAIVNALGKFRSSYLPDGAIVTM
ncbi:RimJ/RimL family protein N-acetyltransferase [Duganella sp. 3397]|uniref:GNAT family N-acetyltransferase n=1 Tax=Duganella sp. 3397 TaxID=2817732 RepID=UPI002861A9FF|nr:GNAT family N-acetyltransferase [Duganella sp. 3397]MDR7047610.1 RimJ/RimL family protein N-acetyltransferase [Duganella sp. 3397]